MPRSAVAPSPLSALVLLVVLVLVAGCRGGDGGADDAALTTTTLGDAPSATSELRFEGDPDSPFCQRSREAAEQPVLDPFEPGLEPREVELRFRALVQRFEGFAEIAPEPLEDDLALLDARFEQLAEVLESADYDFERLAAAGTDVSIFDDEALGAVAARLAAYQEQVCRS